MKLAAEAQAAHKVVELQYVKSCYFVEFKLL